MSFFSDIRERLQMVLFRAQAERDLDEEMSFHLDMETERLIREGLPREEAARRARITFGGLEQNKEEVRDARGTRWLEEFVSDVRYAVRTLRRTPAFTTAAILTLALGIGATTSIFTVVNALFLRSPDGVHRASELVRLYFVRNEGMIQVPNGGPGSYLDFRAIRTSAPAFSGLAAFMSDRDFDLRQGIGAKRIRGRAVSQTFFPVLGVKMAAGRWFYPEEDSTVGTHPVAVISNRLWQSEFEGDPGVIGRVLLVNGQLLTVVGIAAADFSGIEIDHVEIWVPFSMAPALGLVDQGSSDWRDNPAMAAVNVVGRVPGSTPRELVAQQSRIAVRHAAEDTPQLDSTPGVLLGPLVPAGNPGRSQSEKLSLWLLVVTVIVLFVACANVASLMLSRALARERETAVRSSLGAARGRLFRQHLTESMVMAVGGGIAGLLIALWGARVAAQFSLPSGAATLDSGVLMFALALTLVTGVVFGVIPAWHAGRVQPADGLKEAAGGARPTRARFRGALVGLQVAMTAVLLVGAVLFLRSLRQVYAVDPGVDTERILVLSVDLTGAGFSLPERNRFYTDASRRVSQIPGIERVSTSAFGPFSANRYGGAFRVPGHAPLPINGPYMDWVGARYFQTVGTAILQGSGITEQHVPGTEAVAVVNETLASELMPLGEVLGMCVAVGEQIRSGGCTRVVGIAENQRSQYLEGDVDPALYLAREQDPEALPWAGTVLLVRTSGDASVIAGDVRSAVQSMHPGLPFVSIQPLDQRIRADLLPYRVGATLFALFAGLALLLAAVGLYGMLGYSIAERRPELGIRKSLGAAGGDVVRFLIVRGMRPVIFGLVLGLVAAYAGARLLEAMLYDITAREPTTFILVAVFLGVVGLIAIYLPARQAASVDPMVTLRAE